MAGSDAMNIFDLHSAVVADCRDFVRSFFAVADERAAEGSANCGGMRAEG